jgi:hypothetical protein
MSRAGKSKLLIILGAILVLLLILFLTKGAGKAASFSCTTISDPKDKAHCYQWIAKQTSDVSLCDRISDDIEVNPPKNKCYENIAIKENQPELCRLIDQRSIISTTPEACLRRVAYLTGNREACDGITDAASREECLARAGQGIGQE